MSRIKPFEKNQRSGQFYRNLYIRDNEEAQIQFISRDFENENDILLCYVHRTAQYNSTNGKLMYPIYICPIISNSEIEGNTFIKTYFKEPYKCIFCQSNVDSERKTSLKSYYWVYVFDIWHQNDNPRVGRDDRAKPWNKRVTTRGTFFIETVHAPMILEQSSTFSSKLKADYVSRNPRIDNMVFVYQKSKVVTRYGEKSMHSIITDPSTSPIPDSELMTFRNSLPSLDSIVVPNIMQLVDEVEDTKEAVVDNPIITENLKRTEKVLDELPFDIDGEVEKGLDGYLKGQGLID